MTRSFSNTVLGAQMGDGPTTCRNVVLVIYHSYVLATRRQSDRRQACTATTCEDCGDKKNRCTETRVHALLPSNGEVEGPAEASGRAQVERSSSLAPGAAGQAPRAHNILQRPRRQSRSVSRTPPTIVRGHHRAGASEKQCVKRGRLPGPGWRCADAERSRRTTNGSATPIVTPHSQVVQDSVHRGVSGFAHGAKVTPNGEVEGPDDHARLEPRAHTVFPRPRRHYRVSRTPPTMVRRLWSSRGRGRVNADSFRKRHAPKVAQM